MKSPAASRIEEELKQYRWFHSFELEPGVRTTAGVKPLDIFALFALEGDLTGKRILEIGTWDGCYAFELEARGASVVAIDIQNPEATGFAFAKRVKNSNVSYVRCSVYELSEKFPQEFDCVLFMGVFYHLRNPIYALEQIASVIRPGGLLCFEGEYLSHYAEPATPAKTRYRLLSWLLARSAVPVTLFYADAYKNDSYNWFIPNAACLAEWLKAAGFRVERMKPLSEPGKRSRSGRFAGVARIYDRLKLLVSGDYQRIAGTARKLEAADHRQNEFEIIRGKQQTFASVVSYTADSYFQEQGKAYLRDAGSAQVNASIRSALPANDQFGWALRFSPERASVVTIAPNPEISFSSASAFSIELGFKPMSCTPSCLLDQGGKFGILWQGPDQPLQFGRHNAAASGRNQWPLGRWYHIVITADENGDLTLFVDGQCDTTTHDIETRESACWPTCIGATVADGHYFDGFIDEFRCYGFALSQPQVSRLHRQRIP